MRIVFLNCGGGFRNKRHYLTAFNADLYIIAEAESPQKILAVDYHQKIQDYLYVKFPRDKKGLFVYTLSDNSIVRLNWDDFRMRYFCPFSFRGYSFLGVWAKDNYIEDIYLYARFHLNDLKNAILIGDFNSNVIWDEEHGYRTHSDFNEIMDQIGHVSVYHSQEHVDFGKERQATFYLYRHLKRPYHIDYVYAPQNLKCHISFGNVEFIQHSDHLPIILDIK